MEWFVESVASLAGWAKISVVAGIVLIFVGLVFGKGGKIVDPSQFPTPDAFKLTIDLPAAGAEVSEQFPVQGRIENPIKGYRYWLMAVDDFDTKYWPQQELVLDANGYFNSLVNWPLKNVDFDTATIAIIALHKNGLRLLDAHFKLPKNQRPVFIDPEKLSNEGGAIVLQTRGIKVVR